MEEPIPMTKLVDHLNSPRDGSKRGSVLLADMSLT